jgi:hypothetical protein
MKVIKMSLLVVVVLCVLSVLGGVVLPAIIRGFFYLLLIAMKNPLEALVLITSTIAAYVLGLWMNRNKSL